MSPEDDTEKPILRVVRGNPTAEEIAAVVAVLATATVSEPEPPAAKPSRWADPAGRIRQPVRPGPDAWVRSALPR